MSPDSGLAQYACDHCKQRKLRCSREIPRCRNCKDWAGACIYSRHGRIRRRPRSKQVPQQCFNSRDYADTRPPSVLSRAAASSHPSAKDNVPAAPLSDNSSPSEHISISRTTDSYRFPDNEEQTERVAEDLLDNDHGRLFYLGPPSTASFFSQPNSNISHKRSKLWDKSFQISAENSLSDLTKTFAAANFDGTSNVRTSMRSFRRNNEVFFIPEKEEGMMMMQIFITGIEKGRPFFTGPPPDLLAIIVFQPSTVHERGWLLLFNAFLSTALSLMSSPDPRLNRGVQWNTWMLLDDSSIFLEPSEISIQALVLVATHGQEISTPSLCWTLVSQACQMAQSLAIHLPTRVAPIGSEVYSQRLCVFWSLFILDKSLSLSFGRPPLLPGYLYKAVPSLDSVALANYRPHKKAEALEASLTSPSESFGSFYIMRSKALADIEGDIQDTFHRRGRSGEVEIATLRKTLDMWMEKTRQSTPEYEDSLVDPDEKAAVRLGIDNLTFQYHHLTVYLTKGNTTNHDTCLAAARSAISMLDSLVSNSTQVFNGIVWQLLYQPFTPYFVLFANIISDPNSADCFADLQLLRKVVLYFLQMHNNHQSAKRLEKVAETFTRLAEAYVRQSMQGTKQASSGREEILESMQAATDSITGYTNTVHSSTDPSFSDVSSSSQPSSSILFSQNDRPQFVFDDLDSDPMTLLNFFSLSDSNFSSTGSFTTGITRSPVEANDVEIQQQQYLPGSSTWGPDSLIRGLENIAQNYSLDGSFDWFSWDQYDVPTT